MRDSVAVLVFSLIVWIFMLRFFAPHVSYVDNGMEKLDKYWKKVLFSIPVVVFVICIVGLVGEVIEFIGTAIQKISEFLALPVLYLLGMN